MIRFNKLSTEDIHKLIREIVLCLLLFAFSIVVFSISHILSENYQTLSESEDKLNNLNAEYSQLTAEISRMDAELSELKNTADTQNFSREDLVVILGESAKNTGTSMVRLSSQDMNIADSIAKYNFKFELKGSMTQIAETLVSLDNQGLHYAINEMSLRQEADYLWLQRNFEEQIDWWDLSNVTTVGGLQSNAAITSNDIIQDNTMTLYLDVDFIFVINTESYLADVEPVE